MNDFNDLQRFLDRIEKAENGCWIWTGKLGGSHRNPEFYFKGRRRSAKRIAWLVFTGKRPPKDQSLWSSCGDTRCVNPEHQVLQSGIAKREVCHRGHELTPENVYVTSQGRRACRTCIRDNSRTYRKANREKINANKRSEPYKQRRKELARQKKEGDE